MKISRFEALILLTAVWIITSQFVVDLWEGSFPSERNYSINYSIDNDTDFYSNITFRFYINNVLIKSITKYYNEPENIIDPYFNTTSPQIKLLNVTQNGCNSCYLYDNGMVYCTLMFCINVMISENESIESVPTLHMNVYDITEQYNGTEKIFDSSEINNEPTIQFIGGI